MGKYLLSLIILIIIHFPSLAQDQINNEVHIQADNDFFVPFVGTDKYYTYGQKFYYRKRLDNIGGFILTLDRLLNPTGSNILIEIEVGQENG
jgi:predicted acetyltransferase